MNLTYLRPLYLPATVRIQCQVIQNGRSARLVRGAVTSRDGKVVYSTCEHHKISIAGVGRGDGQEGVRASKL